MKLSSPRYLFKTMWKILPSIVDFLNKLYFEIILDLLEKLQRYRKFLCTSHPVPLMLTSTNVNATVVHLTN